MQNKICERIIKIGNNKGNKCYRINCNIHKRYINIIEYLCFPKEYEKCKIPFYLNKNLFEFYKFCSHVNDITETHTIFINSYIRFIISILNMNPHLNNIITMYLFNLYDTYQVHIILKNQKNIKNNINNVLSHRMNIPYFRENFELNKRYYSKIKNKRYKLNLLKNYIIFSNIVTKLYFEILHERYKPYGKGYYESKISFYS